jgi:putative serine protease PepD
MTEPRGWSSAPADPRRRNRVATAVAAAVAVVALSGGSAVAGGYAALHLQPHSTATQSSTVVAATGTSTNPSSLSTVAAAVLPSVVSVTTGSAVGSGVIITSDGAILTNNHVVATARGGSVQVTFSNGKTAPATIVGTDPSTDLAVIRATGVSGLTPLAFGDSSAVHVGDEVLAVGSPLGLDGSVTAGIVSALNRTIDVGNNSSRFGGGQTSQITGAIQTDAAINPGNSGGALVDTGGALIGINTAIATTSSNSGSIGVGFAIPSNTARQVAERLLNG